MSTGRVLALVFGCLLLLPGAGLLFAGGGAGLGYAAQGSDGFIDASLERIETPTSAITAEGLVLVVEPDAPELVFDVLDVETRLVVSSPTSERAIFVGIGPEADVDAYLDGVAHAQVTAVQDRTAVLATSEGAADPGPPAEEAFWDAQASGPGAQELQWTPDEGRWAAVVMNADGSPGVAADVEVGVHAGFLLPLAIVLAGLGILLLVVGIVLVVAGAAGGTSRRPPSSPTTGPPTEPVEAAVGAAPGAPRPSSTAHPVALTATIDPDLSRGMWLIKWLLAIPHVVVLAFLWVAFVVLTFVAFFAILFTGRYPRGIFEFNVGVLRWSWRVSYYAGSGGLGTDRYPPFTLADDPSYPARFDITYAERFSRGLLFVKWLLAIPHFIIVGLLVGGAVQWTNEDTGARFDPTGGGGILGILAFIAVVILLFSGSYPRQLWALIVGLNRWVYRVGAYAAFLTDTYPPFRLDQGGDEPPPRPEDWPPPTTPPTEIALDEPTRDEPALPS